MRILISDTSVLLNLLAGGCLPELPIALGIQFGVCPAVRSEVKTLRDPHTREMVPVDILPHLESGILQAIDLSGADEAALYVAEAAIVDDGEAMAIAIASNRNWELAIDDDRASKHVARTFPGVKLWDTPLLLRTWHSQVAMQDRRCQTILQAIETRARYFPGKGHPLWAWWRGIRQLS